MVDVPVRRERAPVGTEFLTRADVYERMMKDTRNMPEDTQTSKIIMFYNKTDRILFAMREESSDEIKIFEYHSTSPMIDMKLYKSCVQKFQRGMRADAHFADINGLHNKCDDCFGPCIGYQPNGTEYGPLTKRLMCDKCWNEYKLNKPEIRDSQRCMWMEFDCRGPFDKDKTAFTRNSSNEVTALGKELLIDFYMQYNKRLAPCSSDKCDRIALMPIAASCSFPCECGTRIVHKCCNEFHPPLPCRILKRWRGESNKESADKMMARLSLGPSDNFCPRCDAKDKLSVTTKTAKCGECRFQYCRTCQKKWDGVGAHDHNGPETIRNGQNYGFVEKFLATKKEHDEMSMKFMLYTSCPQYSMAEHKKSFEKKKVQINASIDSQIAKIGQFHYNLLNIVVFNFYTVSRENAESGNAESGNTEPSGLDNILDLLEMKTSCMNPDELKEWQENLMKAIKDLEEKMSTFMQKAAKDIREGRLLFIV